MRFLTTDKPIKIGPLRFIPSPEYREIVSWEPTVPAAGESVITATPAPPEPSLDFTGGGNNRERKTMYRSSKRFYFSASHMQPYPSREAKESHLHGHDYTVEIVRQCSDVVPEFGDKLAMVKEWIAINLDRAHICTSEAEAQFIEEAVGKIHEANSKPMEVSIKPRTFVLGEPPTTENLARCIYDRFNLVYPDIEVVRVATAGEEWGEYRP